MTSGQSEFSVNLTIQAAGPIRPRTKYKTHKLLRGEASIMLPFVPYPGLHLTFSKPKKRGLPLTLYLRVRAVEWNITERRFECTVDEILGSSLFAETYEVRGGARFEDQFVDLQRMLLGFGFDVITDANGLFALHKREDGVPFRG